MRKIIFAFLSLLAISQYSAVPVRADAAGEREMLIRGYAETIKSMRAKGVLPIIDVEHHWSGKIPVQDLIANMDSYGVALTWLGQKEEKGSFQAFKFTSKYPARLVPTAIHGDGPRWHGRDASLIVELEKDVGTGRFFAMGEFEGRHYISGSNDRDVHTPVDSPGFEAVFTIAQERGIPFLIHHEAEDRLLPEIERMLARYPRANVIWCHVGRNRDRSSWTVLPTTAGMRGFLKKYPNLYFDLNQSKPGGRHRGTGQEDSVLYEIHSSAGRGRADREDAGLKQEWKQLFEEYPDRFLIGSDINTQRWDRYGDVMERFRKLVLGSVSKEAAERIAWKNAWKLMTGREWKE